MFVRALCPAVVSLALFSGCVSPDIEIRNPLVARALDQNRIVKMHEYTENNRGLPRGSVADEATLVSVDAQQLCVAVSMHELAPIDLQSVQAELKMSNGNPLSTPQIQAEAPTALTYSGLNPQRQVVGSQQVCISRATQNSPCNAWQTQPIYSTVWVRGPVTVYQTKGMLCFPHQGVIAATTRYVTLLLRVPQQGQPGFMGIGTSMKEVLFSWGFTGFTKS